MGQSYYSFFSPMLDDSGLGLDTTALVGKLITCNAELNALLAGSKGVLERGVWVDFADGLSNCRRRCEAAWARYAEIDFPTTEDRAHLDEAFAASVAQMQDLISRFPHASS
ncbi:hypothetical protein Rhe02_88700 [Rhizocola hellebori]|uniref:Uncharacterized protein n=1 Tax=Rhizocola hellebori TaxID=1392758 RepID=A0A8J3QH65_9ACTN|nr:hypothetical protein [Rhizocola hellebori]GIH10803.1 hypothetical protein Rhe02_88700 [Rhizocola hellebori]